MRRGVCLGVSHASHSKRAEFQDSPVFGVLLYLCLHPLTPNDQTRHGNAPQFWGSLLFMHTYISYHISRQCVGGSLFLGVSHTPPKGGGVPALPNFGGPFIFMHQPNRGGNLWAGACFRGSATTPPQRGVASAHSGVLVPATDAHTV